MYDIAIAGGGPAGVTAAIYAARAGCAVAVFERLFIGGQLANTNEIENYPGLGAISGYDLISKFDEHLSKFKTERIPAEVTNVRLCDNAVKLKTPDGDYDTRALIIATGASPKPLNIKGEAEFTGKGVSYCASCDGNFYKNRITAVIGGGNTALHDALYLSNICETVYLIHRRDTFRADDLIVDRVKQTPNIKLILNTTVKEIKGDNTVGAIILASGETVLTNGVFVAIGTIPRSDFIKSLPGIELNENGAIITNERMETGAPGIYAAGDVRNTPLRQIITAAADGAIAATYAAAYVQSMKGT